MSVDKLRRERTKPDAAVAGDGLTMPGGLLYHTHTLTHSLFRPSVRPSARDVFEHNTFEAKVKAKDSAFWGP